MTEEKTNQENIKRQVADLIALIKTASNAGVVETLVNASGVMSYASPGEIEMVNSVKEARINALAAEAEKRKDEEEKLKNASVDDVAAAEKAIDDILKQYENDEQVNNGRKLLEDYANGKLKKEELEEELKKHQKAHKKLPQHEQDKRLKQANELKSHVKVLKKDVEVKKQTKEHLEEYVRKSDDSTAGAMDHVNEQIKTLTQDIERQEKKIDQALDTAAILSGKVRNRVDLIQIHRKENIISEVKIDDAKTNNENIIKDQFRESDHKITEEQQVNKPITNVPKTEDKSKTLLSDTGREENNDKIPEKPHKIKKMPRKEAANLRETLEKQKNIGAIVDNNKQPDGPNKPGGGTTKSTSHLR